MATTLQHCPTKFKLTINGGRATASADTVIHTRQTDDVNVNVACWPTSGGGFQPGRLFVYTNGEMLPDEQSFFVH